MNKSSFMSKLIQAIGIPGYRVEEGLHAFHPLVSLAKH